MDTHGEASYIREPAENVYAVRYTFKLGTIGSTHDQGMFVDYFAARSLWSHKRLPV